MILPAELIKKKRSGLQLTRDEISDFIGAYVREELPDYQMAAFLMAVFFQGMTPVETATLTEVMLHSGKSLDFSHLAVSAVDKHSTGGVGDKTSMIIAPLVAAAGVPVPMIAGRGLGHTGGTLDKLESIPGFRVGLSLDQFLRQVETLGVAIIGQTEEICPADKRIYALRDVTGTVESLPLICASIMSKKLAEGIKGLVLDVKFGSGAFMKTPEAAENLARGLMAIGLNTGKKVTAFLTSMEQPLGRMAGNALEIEECLAILKQEPTSRYSLTDIADTEELSVSLAAEMLLLAGVEKTEDAALKRIHHLLHSGAGYEMFEKICHAQGGVLSQFKCTAQNHAFKATDDGFIESFDCEKLGLATLALGAGRFKKSDHVDPQAGFMIHKKLGDRVEKGETIFTLYSQDAQKFPPSEKLLEASVKISFNRSEPSPLILKKLKA